MADFSFGYSYAANVTIQAGTVTLLNSVATSVPGPFAFSDPGDLNVGDSLTVVIGGFPNTFIYKGFVENLGIILEGTGFFAGQHFLLSNSSSVTVPSPIPVVTDEPYPECLLAGTMIATPSGERPVEEIQAGDQVLTAEGQPVVVRWSGRQSFITLFAGQRSTPVVIRAGALDEGVPAQDLYVSPDHAVLVDGCLVNAHALVNGSTITRMPEPPAQLDYYHLELDSHRIILANGTPVESFVDDVSRVGFDNFQEWVDLGLDALPAEPIGYLKVKSARQLPVDIKARLDARSTTVASA